MSKSVERRVMLASVICTCGALVARLSGVRPDLGQEVAAGLSRPAAVRELHVPHRRRFKARGQCSLLVIVVPNWLVHPAPVIQQRIGRPGNGYRALIGTEARGT